MIDSFETFVTERYPAGKLTPLSDSNNRVYRVDDSGASLIVKHITDVDIPLDYLATVNHVIGTRLPTQRVVEIHQADADRALDIVISQYVLGVDLASVVGQPDRSPEPDTLARFFVDFIESMFEAPPLHPGFGLFKRGAPMFDRRSEFLEYYASRYWGRARPFFDHSVQALVDRWVGGGLGAAVAAEDADATVAIDANLKNFLVSHDRSLTVLNVPIAGTSSVSHAVGALSVHLRHHPARTYFLDEASRRLQSVSTDLIPHFEMWNMLGILSFYAVREPDEPDRWRNFASPRGLRDDFEDLAQSAIG